MSKVIDLNYVKKEQDKFIGCLHFVEGINYQEGSSKVPKWLILALSSELMEVLNESKVHKWWDTTPRDKNKLLEELSDLLSHLGNLANLLGLEMISDIKVTQERGIESIFTKTAYDILSIELSKTYARTKFPQLIVDFIELVYSLGFDMEEIKEAYFIKMSENYLRFL